MARFKHVAFFTLEELTYLEKQASEQQTTMSAVIAACVRHMMHNETVKPSILINRKAQEHIPPPEPPITWETVFIVGTNNRLITKEHGQYFNWVTRSYIDQTEVDSIVKWAQDERDKKLHNS